MQANDNVFEDNEGKKWRQVRIGEPLVWTDDRIKDGLIAIIQKEVEADSEKDYEVVIDPPAADGSVLSSAIVTIFRGGRRMKLTIMAPLEVLARGSLSPIDRLRWVDLNDK